MDFSKIKKILIILCIASVLLNIISKFSKVFADYQLVADDDNLVGTIDLDDTFTDNYWALFVHYGGSGGSYVTSIISPDPITFYYGTYGFNSNVLYVSDNLLGYRRGGSSTHISSVENMATYVQSFVDETSSGYTDNGSIAGEINNMNVNLDVFSIFSNHTLYLENGNEINSNVVDPPVAYPELLNSSLTLENLSLLGYKISAGDYEDVTFYALFYDRSILNTDDFWDFPQVVIELSPYNEYYWEGDTDKKYEIPITDVPLTYKAGTTYSVAFAVKQFSSTGGGFRGDDWTWEFLGLPRSWTTLSSVSVDLDELNAQTDKQNLINYQNNVTNNLTNIYDSLTGTDTTDNDNTLAQSGVITENNQDITASGFDNIFNMFYNGITANPVDIVFPIPFTQQTITIHPDYIRNALGTNNILLNLIESFWYFAVSLYIVKDIENLIRKMKNGDVATSSDTNIKADML